jgi:hypothetical protein
VVASNSVSALLLALWPIFSVVVAAESTARDRKFVARAYAGDKSSENGLLKK